MPAKHDLCRGCKEFGKTYICEKCSGCEECCSCNPLNSTDWFHRDSRRGLQLIKLTKRAGQSGASD